MLDLSKIIKKGVRKADLHIHSNHSDGNSSIEDILGYVQNKTDLDVIAITDHDTITGAVIAKKLAKKLHYKFEVVVGEEVTAKEGHILGYFLKEPVTPGMSAHETIKAIQDQGGFAVAAHPFFQTRIKSPNMITMDGVGFMVLVKEKFNAIETANACMWERANRKARIINRSMLFINETGGSDAHILHAIGKSYTLFAGKTAEDLRRCFKLWGYTQGTHEKWTTWSVFLYLIFFFPKIIELIKSMFLKNERRTISLLNRREMNRFKREKKILENLSQDNKPKPPPPWSS